MFSRDRIRILSLLIVPLFIAVACGGGQQTGGGSSGGGLPVVKLQGMEGGLSAMALKIIEQQGFDKANGFQGQYFEVSGDASIQFLLQGNSDVSFDCDPITAALLRSQGNDISTFYPVALQDVELMVRGDSPYQSPEDLLGKKVGHDGLESGSMTAANIMLGQFNDIHITEDYALQLVPEAALIRLLDQGELEASFMAQPFVLTAKLDYGMRSVWGPGWKEWQEATGGGSAWNITVCAHEQWIRDNLETAKAVTAAWDDAYNWIKEDPERLRQDPFPALVGIDDPAVLDAFIELARTTGYFTNSWTAADVEAAKAFVQLAAKDGTIIQEAPEGSVISLQDLAAGPAAS